MVFERKGLRDCRVTGDLSTTTQQDITADSFEDQTQPSSFSEKYMCQPLRSDLNFSRTKNTTDKSLLQRYVERFRHGTPMSREERQRLGTSELKEFWWLNSPTQTPSDSSTPKDDVGGRTKKCRPSSFTVSKEESELNEKSLFHVDDDDATFEMQEKADRLLELSECSLGSSGPAISTEGLGSSSSDVYSFKQYHSLPSAAHNRDAAKRETTFTRVIPAWTSGPEDDILYRWRLQRKLEVARQGVPTSQVSKPHRDADSKLEEFRQRLSRAAVSSTTSQPCKQTVTTRPDSYHTLSQQAEVETQTTERTALPDRNSDPSTRQLYKEPVLIPQSLIASPTASRDRPGGLNIDPHYHTVCDLLPCPHSPKYADNTGSRRQRENRVNTDLNSSCSDCESDRHGTRYKQYLQAEKPDSEKKMKSRTRTDRCGSELETRHDRELLEETGKKKQNSRTRTDRCVSDSETRRDGELLEETGCVINDDETEHKSGKLLNTVQFTNEVEIHGRSRVREADRLLDRTFDEDWCVQDELSVERKPLGVNQIRRDFDTGTASDRGMTSEREFSIPTSGPQLVHQRLCTFPQTGQHIPRPLMNQLWNTERELRQTDCRRVVEERPSVSNHPVRQSSSGGVVLNESSCEERWTGPSELAAESAVFKKVAVSRRTDERRSDGGVRRGAVNNARPPAAALSSSPQTKATRLNSAIEQVVEDHLFCSSELTLVSSVDSWTSLADSRQHGGPASQLDLTDSVVVDVDAASSEENPTLDTETAPDPYESDGEFPDDSLLQMLRRQRALFEEKLRNIDHLISQASLSC